MVPPVPEPPHSLHAAGLSRPAQEVLVSVIIPARNEEACLGACLQSLVAQRGVSFEIIVVNDASTDRTRAIGESFAGSSRYVKVVEAGPLPRGWTGKSHALAAGVTHARGAWLLFTDADTVHLPGSLATSLREAQEQGAALLSYSPEQEVHGFWEKAVMPVIFAELTATYRTSEINDPASAAAAANGQYLLIHRGAYEKVGGHAAIDHSLLEDVELARAVKRAGYRLWFRFGGGLVRTRMYRSFTQLCEGWTKNLALLFPDAGRLAGLRLTEFVLIACGAGAVTIFGARGAVLPAVACGLGAVGAYCNFWRRIRRAHFAWDANLLALLGLPLFAFLLLRSKLSYQSGAVTWKGRTYGGGCYQLESVPTVPISGKA